MEPTKQKKSFFSSLKNLIIEKGVLVFGTFIVALLSIFSDAIVNKVKSGVNRANETTACYQDLSNDFSVYLFEAENSLEFIKGKNTNSKNLYKVFQDYNNSITVLRRKEYANYALIHKIWKPKKLESFKSLMNDVKSLDATIHQFNPIFDHVKENEKIVYTSQMADSIKKNVPIAEHKISLLKSNFESFINGFK